MDNALVTYFSASGQTAKKAKKLAEAIEADLYEIKPAVPYSKADLNWNDKRSRSSLEMNDPTSRPELLDIDAPIANYDTIFIGFPIWWNLAPSIIKSFLDAYDFSGKKIILFATSGGSGIGNAEADLKRLNKGQIVDAKLLGGLQTSKGLKKWVDSLS